MKSIFPTLLFWFLSALTASQSVFRPARPPSIPLAVKSPYLSLWVPAGSDGGNGGYLAGETITFWNGASRAWTGLIRVDGQTYTWMGKPGPRVKPVFQRAFEYTSTKSIFTLDVGSAIEMTVTFTSPLAPNDFKRQSLIFSYLDVSIVSKDGQAHNVQLYGEITGEHASGDNATKVKWDYGVTTSGVAYHKLYRQTQLLWSEISDQAEWGYWYWSTKDDFSMTHQSGPNLTLQDRFARNGRLSNGKDTEYRAISDRSPAFAFAKNLGRVYSTPVSTLFTIGLAQDQAIQFDGANGNVSVLSLWKSYFKTGEEALEFHYNDYPKAFRKATRFDNQIRSDSISAGGDDYLAITSLSARQAFGATQLTGTPKKPYLFLKEISSDGNTQTVDVIFPFHPILGYTNPVLLKLLLDPLFEHQESGQYPNKYSMHDLGSHYPNATGHPDGKDEQQPLEECGNMLIMTLAYAQRALGGIDTGYLKQHYKLLNQWTQYLVKESLIPADQISTDDFAGSLANQTDLALKGIIGIEAMATIADLVGNTDDAKNYTKIARQYIKKWEQLGTAFNAKPPHTTLSYGMNDTHGLLYNLYGDRELNLNLVPYRVYERQSRFYPTVQTEYGVPLDTRQTTTKADWEMFTASVAQPSTQRLFIQKLATWISETTTNLPFTDKYDAVTGDFPSGSKFAARPVMGGSFAFLNLNGAANATRFNIGNDPPN